MRHSIGFITVPGRTKLSGGKVNYSGRIVHNRLLKTDDITKGLMAELHLGEAQACFLVNGLCEYIAHQLQEGNQLDFGGFRIGLTVRGGFPAANAAFSSKNRVAVVMTPGKMFKKAVENLNPENRTDLSKPHIHSIQDMKLEPKYGMWTIACHSEALLIGWGFASSYCRDDDGVWIENRARERVAKARIVFHDFGMIRFVIDDDVPAGEYWFVLGCRESNELPVVTARRLIQIVAQ